MSGLYDHVPQRRAIIDRRKVVEVLDAAVEAAPPEGRRQAVAAVLKVALEQGRAEIRRRIGATPGRGTELASAQSFLTDQILRIAGVITLFEDAEAAEIAKTTMEGAITLANYYLHEAMHLLVGPADRLLARAVGRALARNPFAPVVPCHRVLGADGRPGGFSARGGLQTKLQLLTLEGASPTGAPDLFVPPRPGPGESAH